MATKSKIRLGQRPKSFNKAVEFQMHDGTKGLIEWVFKYRTRKEYGEFIDQLVENGRAKAADLADQVTRLQQAPAVDKDADGPAGADAEAAPPAAGAAIELPSGFTTNFVDATTQSNVDHVFEIAEGWNLDAPFTRENVEQLCNELPGAISAAIDAYRGACVEGRLGN